MKKISSEALAEAREQNALYKTKLAEKIIDGMSDYYFRRHLKNGVCRKPTFQKLVDFGAESLDNIDKIAIRGDLSWMNIPANLTDSDEVLNNIATIIVARSNNIE